MHNLRVSWKVSCI